MDKDKNTAVIGQIPEKLSQRRKIPKLPLIVIAVLIGLGGAYAVIRSLADTSTVPGAGHINFIRDATSSFDNYTANATPAQQQWMNQHYSRMRGYSPFFDQALGWAPPTDFYRDLYAIYTTDTSTVSQHPDWILKDNSGQKLYIPSGCDGTTCPQYAGDIGNADFRQAWIDKAKTDLAKGYKGIFIDDVDTSIHTSNASGTAVTPIDPRTGQPMTSAAWENYIAEFTEEVRSQLPNAYLEHNAVWSESQSDPYVQREIKSADAIEIERGFNDSGLTGGTGTYGYETFLAHVDWLHSLGKSVIDEPYLTTPTQREFEMASFFLVNNGTDYLTSGYQADPDNWWPGWSTDLGAAHGPRYSWNGFLRRDFDNGFVLTNEPGAITRTVSLGGNYTRLDGTTVSSVQLAAREGAVLLNPASSSSTDTTAPTVSLTAPVGGGTVSGSSVTVSANASDDTGVAGVQFKLDGNNLGSEDTASPYSTTWDTTKTTNGTHTLTVVARDAAGNTKTSSSVTVTVSNSSGGGSGNCTTTLNVGTNVQNALSGAAPGEIICLSAGTWSAQTFSGIAPSSTVTLQPVPGATVHINGITLNGPGNIKNLTVKGFYIDGGVQGLCGIDGNVVFQSNTIQHINAGNAFYFYANGCGGSHVQTGVSMIGNQMDHVGECLTVAGGASIEKNFTFKNNVCGPDIGAGVTKGNQYSHYIEIGCMAGGTFDNNAFLGPYDATALSNSDPATAVHNNVFHCFGDGSNISFSNNILWHTQSRAQTVLVQSGKMDNITIHNNVFVNDPFCHATSNNCPAQDIEVYATHGLNVTNNTVATTAWGLHFPSVCTDGCYASGTDETLTNNIVESAATDGNADYAEWGCASSCVTGNNVSYDSSAVGSPSVKNWTPSYTMTNWTPHDGEPYSPPPSGYYVAKGLPFTAGWDGTGGPQGDVGALNGSSGSGTTPPADTTKPTVSITTPTSGATVSGIVTATAAAADNVGVSKVDFYLDNATSPTISDSASPYNYSFDSKTLTNGSHTITAKAYDAAGNTSSATVTTTVSNPDTTPPSAPTNVKATAANATTVNLTWDASTDNGINATGVVKYDVLRNGVVIAQPTTTSYTDTTAVANTSYSYAIQAVDGAGNVSANSATATATTPAAPDTTPPTTPSNVKATAVSSSQVNLTWDASTDSGGSGLAGYNVYRGGSKLNSSPIATTSYGDSTASASATYTYKIEAVDGAGNKSAQTSGTNVTTPAAPDTTAPTVSIAAPVNNATVSGSGVTVSANASDDQGVVGVQFKLDGNNLNAEVTTVPYTITWDTTKTTNGTHTLTATARDTAGNTKTSASVTITVSNSTAVPGISFARTAVASNPDFSNVSQDAAHYQFVVMQSWQTSELHALKAANSNVKVLAYYNLTGMSYPSGGQYSGCVDPTNAPESYFLHNQSGQRFTFNDYSYIWAANQGDSAYQQSCANHIISDLTSKGFDGVMLDDTNYSIKYHYTPSQVKEYPTDVQYGAATKSAVAYIGPRVQVAGKLIIPNMGGTYAENADFNDSLLQYVSGAYDEFFVSWPGGTLQPDSNRARAMQSIATAESIGKYYVANTVGTSASDTKTALYGLASSMLVSGRYTSFGFSAGDYSTDIWLPIFDTAKSLGAPAGDSYMAGSVQRRNFTNGVVLVNPTASTQTVSLGGTFTGSGLTNVTSVSMPAQTGLILQASSSPPPDTTKPTVSFASPTNNATVSGIVTATANASDDVGVTKVEISLDGSLKMTDTSSPYNYSFDSKTLSNGAHTISAKAYDAAGNASMTSITVNVNNADTTPPSAPTNVKATASNATTVNLTWDASTDASGIAKYNVLRNGVVIAQSTTTSYTDTTAVANTAYSYVIQAVDGAGNVSANSSAATVTTPKATTTDQDLLFNGTKVSDYSNQSAPGAVTEVPDPAGSSQTVFKMVVKNTDVAPVTPTDNPRAQLVSPGVIQQGSTFWLSTRIYVPSDFPTVPSSGWFCGLQVYGEPYGGTPPWSVCFTGNNIDWSRNATYRDQPWEMPLPKNQWVSIVLHEKLASDGFVEMWVNGQQVTFFNGNTDNPSHISPTTHLVMQTADGSNNGGPNTGDLQSYRMVDMFDTVTLYEWPMKIGTTQASVQDSSGNGTPQADTTPPTTPTNLKATAASATQVNLTWDASTDSGGSGLAGYNVYRGGTKLNSSPITTTSYGDSTANASTSYTYKIEAIDGAGNKSPQTSGVNVTTPAAPDTTAPSTPTNLKATAASATQINLTWKASTDSGGSGLAGYNVYRNGTQLNTAPLSAATYSDANVQAATAYQYAVQAVDKAGNTSDKTGTVSVTTPAAPTTGHTTGGTGNSGGNSGHTGHGSSDSTGSSGSSGGTHRYPVTIQVYDRHHQPAYQAQVSLYDQTTQTDHHGEAHFSNIPSGKHDVSVNYGGQTVQHSVTVKNNSSSKSRKRQTIKFSLAGSNLSPVLLLVPVVALVAGGLVIFRPWNSKLSRAAAGAAPEDRIVSSSHPSDAPTTQPGRKLETPGTVYKPTDHDDSPKS